MTAGRDVPHGGHAATVQLVSQRSRASADSGETSSMASGCRRSAPAERKDSIRSGDGTSPAIPSMSAVFGLRSRSNVETYPAGPW